MTRIAMLLDHNGAYDSRVEREARALQNAGYEIKIFCKTTSAPPANSRAQDLSFVDCDFDPSNTLRRPFKARSKPTPQKDVTSKVDVGPYTQPAPTQNVIKKILGTALSFHSNLITVRDAVLRFSPAIIHAHDLSMLPAGRYLSKKLSIPLIYDSHEYEYDRNIVEHPLQSAIRHRAERRCVAHCLAVITVSDSIADAIAQRHKISRPHLVLNSATKALRPTACISRKNLHLPPGQIGVYFGGAQNGRGLHQAMEALTYGSDMLCIFGSITSSERMGLLRQAEKMGVRDRIFLRNPLPLHSLANTGNIFDYAIIPIQKTCASYDFSLPNKLFQSTAAGLPLVATPLKEISRFIRYFSAGVIAGGFTGADIADAIKTLPGHKGGPDTAKSMKAYAWAASEDTLLSIYDSILRGSPMPPSNRLPHSRPG